MGNVSLRLIGNVFFTLCLCPYELYLIFVTLACFQIWYFGTLFTSVYENVTKMAIEGYGESAHPRQTLSYSHTLI